MIVTKLLIGFLLVTLYGTAKAQEDDAAGYKITMEMTATDLGAVITEVETKYNAATWDIFTRQIGANTSILMNQYIKSFPKYHLSEFNYTQNVNERSNKTRFKIEGMLNINKDGKWEADLDKKNPEVTKVSNTELLLVEEGTILKIHLPAGTNDAKVEKDSFGEAFLTFSPHLSSSSGNIMRYLGILVALAGGLLLFKNIWDAKKA